MKEAFLRCRNQSPPGRETLRLNSKIVIYSACLLVHTQLVSGRGGLGTRRVLMLRLVHLPPVPSRTPAGKSQPLSMAQEQDTAAGSVPTTEELLGRALLENASYVHLRFLDTIQHKESFLFLLFWAAPRSMWDLNSRTRDETRVPWSGSAGS